MCVFRFPLVGVVHKIEGDGPLSARKFLCESGMGPGDCALPLPRMFLLIGHLIKLFFS